MGRGSVCEELTGLSHARPLHRKFQSSRSVHEHDRSEPAKTILGEEEEPVDGEKNPQSTE